MLTSKYCIELYGEPKSEKWRHFLRIWNIPKKYRDAIKCLPSKIYCHQKFPEYLMKAFDLIIMRGLQDQIITWDGCYNVRLKKGGETWSIHSWALAIDINAKNNGFGEIPTMSAELVACFDLWFDWGGEWKNPDGMHFQLKEELL